MSAITFTRTTPGTEAADGTFTGAATTTIVGDGILVQGDPQAYARLGLTQAAAPCILFAPSGYPLKAYTDEFVLPGDTTVINSTTYVVREVIKTVAPDGYVVLAKIAVSA